MLKGKLIRLAVLLTIVISPFALAEKAEVYRWEPFPGQTNKIIENMMRLLPQTLKALPAR